MIYKTGKDALGLQKTQRTCLCVRRSEEIVQLNLNYVQQGVLAETSIQKQLNHWQVDANVRR